MAGGVGVKPCDGAADAFSEGDFGIKSGDKALDLRVVEYHAGGLVAGEAAEFVGVAGAEEVGGDVDDLGLEFRGLDACGLGSDAIELIPSHDLVRGDVEGVTDGLLVAEQPDEALGEVAVVGDDPE